MTKVAIAVPTIRNPLRLGRCLDSVRRVAADDGVKIDLIVVLDGADQDVAIFAAEHAPDATVISWPERRGLAAGLNAAFRATNCSHVAVLQDDAVPASGWFATLLDTAGRYPQAGAVGGLVLSPDGTVQSAGAIIGGDGATAPPWIGGWTSNPPPTTSSDKVRAVDYVSSSSVLVSRAAWSAAGGFDEELYPAIYVDADFCTALWNAGWLVLLDPHAVARHDRHGSTSKPFREFVAQRNRVRFLNKWGSFVGQRPCAPLNAAEVEQAVARAEGWLEHPPVAPRRASEAPQAAPGNVYVARERDLLRAYVAELEQHVAESDSRYELLAAAHRELESAHHELHAARDALTSVHQELRRTPWRPAGRKIRRLLRPARRESTEV